MGNVRTAVHPAYASAFRGNATEIPMGGGRKNGRIRELIMPSRGSGKTYLKFRDERFTWYNVPLGKAATRGRARAATSTSTRTATFGASSKSSPRAGSGK